MRQPVLPQMAGLIVVAWCVLAAQFVRAETRATSFEYSSSLFHIVFDITLGDPAPVSFNPRIIDGCASLWRDSCAREVHEPELELVRRIDDQRPLGDAKALLPCCAHKNFGRALLDTVELMPPAPSGPMGVGGLLAATRRHSSKLSNHHSPRQAVVRSRSAENYLFGHDATVASGWPRNLAVAGVFFCSGVGAAVECSGNGTLDAALNERCDQTSPVISSSGTDYPGWPVILSQDDRFTESSPTVVDIDGDGPFDISHGDEGRRIFAWGGGGNSLPGFPFPFTEAVGDRENP